MTVSPLPSHPSARAALDGVGAALDDLGRVAWEHASPGELRAAVAGLEAAAARLDSARLAAARAVDSCGVWAADGAATPQAWLRGAARLAPGQARDRVLTARRLADMPLFAAALAGGEAALVHVRIAARAADANPARRAAFGAAEAILADAARALDPAQFAVVVQRWVAAVDPEGAAAQDLDAFRRRYLHASPVGDGVAVDGFLDPEAGAALLAALHALSEQAWRAGPTETGQTGGPDHVQADPQAPALERPTPAQRRADALADLARHFLASGAAGVTGGVRPQVQLVTTQEALRRGAPADQPPAPRPAEIPGVGPVSGETARRIACDATAHPFLVDPQWQPLAYGRAARVVPPALRRAIAHRDGGCRFAGCHRPAPWCDAHHLTHWAHGGKTDPDNLALVCSYHHHLLHEGGYTLTRSPGGRWTTRRPDGTAIPDPPRAHDHPHDHRDHHPCGPVHPGGPMSRPPP